MSWGRWIAAATIFIGVTVARADDIIHQYEGDVHPLDAGWVGTCEPPCSEGLADGKFFFFWPNGGPLASYGYRISVPPETPPRLFGRNGDSDPTIRWVRISSVVTEGSRFNTATL